MAFSGPKLWDNTISLPFELDPFGVSDIQDVLVENDIKVHTKMRKLVHFQCYVECHKDVYI